MSTRGGEKGLSFEEVLFAGKGEAQVRDVLFGRIHMCQCTSNVYLGYAGDGGLYMPETIPRLSNKDIKRLATFEYGDLVKEICGLFIDQEEIRQNIYFAQGWPLFFGGRGAYETCPRNVEAILILLVLSNLEDSSALVSVLKKRPNLT